MAWDLTADELRVLASLVEKEATTPEQYPLSANALKSACNQKSSRDPVMHLSEADVSEALHSLMRRRLVRTASEYGGRVGRYAHRLGQPGTGAELTREQIAVLCVLSLRGPQTVGELRAHTQRLHAFESPEAVEATLTALADHPAEPLVVRLPREPGRREHRYAQCLSEETEASAPAAEPADEDDGGASAPGLEARVAALEETVRRMRAKLDALTGEGPMRDSGD